jgi:hypothetical protein
MSVHIMYICYMIAHWTCSASRHTRLPFAARRVVPDTRCVRYGGRGGCADSGGAAGVAHTLSPCHPPGSGACSLQVNSDLTLPPRPHANLTGRLCVIVRGRDCCGCARASPCSALHFPTRLCAVVQPHVGQGVVAGRMRNLLNFGLAPVGTVCVVSLCVCGPVALGSCAPDGDKSAVGSSHEKCDRVQDSYTLRCIPQVGSAQASAPRSAVSRMCVHIGAAARAPSLQDTTCATILQFLHAVQIHGICNDTVSFVERILTTECNRCLPRALSRSGADARSIGVVFASKRPACVFQCDRQSNGVHWLGRPFCLVCAVLERLCCAPCAVLVQVSEGFGLRRSTSSFVAEDNTSVTMSGGNFHGEYLQPPLTRV